MNIIYYIFLSEFNVTYNLVFRQVFSVFYLQNLVFFFLRKLSIHRNLRYSTGINTQKLNFAKLETYKNLIILIRESNPRHHLSQLINRS